MNCTSKAVSRILLGSLLIGLSACSKTQNSRSEGAPPAKAQPRHASRRPERVRVVEILVNAKRAVSEASYCIPSEDRSTCESHAILVSDTPSGAVAFSLDSGVARQVTDSAEIAAMNLEVARLRMIDPSRVVQRDFDVDLDRVENVLHLDYFYSIYRCRFTAAIRDLVAVKGRFQGNLVLHPDAFFRSEMFSGRLVGLEFDRRSHQFLGLAIVTDKRPRIAVAGAPPSEPAKKLWSLITAVPTSAEVTGARNVPRGLGFEDAVGRCNAFYDFYLPEPNLDDPAAVAARERVSIEALMARRRYTNVFVPAFEADPEMRDQANVRLSSKSDPVDFTIRSLQTEPLDELYFDPNRFPKFDHQSDQLWSNYQPE